MAWARQTQVGTRPPTTVSGWFLSPWVRRGTMDRAQEAARLFLWPQASPGLAEGRVLPGETALSSRAWEASAQKWAHENHTRPRGHCDHERPHQNASLKTYFQPKHTFWVTWLSQEWQVTTEEKVLQTRFSATRNFIQTLWSQAPGHSRLTPWASTKELLSGHGSVSRPVAGEVEWTWARQWLGSCSESSRTSDRLPRKPLLWIIPTNITGASTWRLWLTPPAPPVGALPSFELTKVEGATPVCVYLSFYSRQLAGARCMARTWYRLSPLFKRSLSANNLLGSVLGAGDGGQWDRGSSYNFQGQYMWRPLWRWSQASLTLDSSPAFSSTPASTSSVPPAKVSPTPCLPVWFEYAHTKYPLFHIFMKLLDLQFYLRAKVKRHFCFYLDVINKFLFSSTDV